MPRAEILGSGRRRKSPMRYWLLLWLAGGSKHTYLGKEGNSNIHVGHGVLFVFYRAGKRAPLFIIIMGSLRVSDRHTWWLLHGLQT